MPDEALHTGGPGMRSWPILLERPDVVRQILDPQFDLSFVESLSLRKFCSPDGHLGWAVRGHGHPTPQHLRYIGVREFPPLRRARVVRSGGTR